MPQKIVVAVLIFILGAVFGYMVLTMKPGNQIPTLTNDVALALVKSTWGSCTQDRCSKVMVSVDKTESGTYVVTAVYEGLRDDSVGAQKRTAPADYQDGVWTLGEPEITQRCWPGRGHQDFSSELCT